MTGRQRVPPVLLVRSLRDFLAAEVAGAVLICVAVVVALVWANSPWSETYESLLHTRSNVGIGSLGLDLDVHAWIGDGLMTLFFLVVGLEIKREMIDGELASVRTAALPAIAALGGMVGPAAIYLLVAPSSASRGWAIPMATDIALALGVLTAFGRRVPTGAKVFLLALAIVDDIGAIAVIAVAYSSGLNAGYLLGAVGCALMVVGLSRVRPDFGAGFVILGVTMWWFTHEAGVHATIAGVVMGLLTPVSRIERIEHRLHPWTSLVIVPLFALANAGIDLGGDALAGAASSRMSWAIVVGLVVGKPVGITAATWLGRRMGLDLPTGVGIAQIVAIGVVGGVGFTVSIFIADLALDGASAPSAKLAILVGSTLAAAFGSIALWVTTRSAQAPR
ncbi:MAG TPA: Na+/H+ antiporter NhaA [Microthrixaceae bacterium]|nr:Na+/H+ antiporter NhaA [Microthrixaceae bacterium]HNI34733.1 Na+/H+ antiporter NhaA [Microthrixaceae bacterium]